MKKPSLLTRRILGGIVLVLCLSTAANYYFGLSLLGGRFDKDAMAISFIAMFLYVIFLTPTMDELREHRDSKRRQQGN